MNLFRFCLFSFGLCTMMPHLLSLFKGHICILNLKINIFHIFSSSSQILKPNEKTQLDMVAGGLSDLLFRVAEGKEAVFCLPGHDSCFEPAAQYGIDGVTEKVRSVSLNHKLHSGMLATLYSTKNFSCTFQLHLFSCAKEEEMKNLIKRYTANVSDSLFTKWCETLVIITKCNNSHSEQSFLQKWDANARVGHISPFNILVNNPLFCNVAK